MALLHTVQRAQERQREKEEQQLRDLLQEYNPLGSCRRQGLASSRGGHTWVI